MSSITRRLIVVVFLAAVALLTVGCGSDACIGPACPTPPPTSHTYTVLKYVRTYPVVFVRDPPLNLTMTVSDGTQMGRILVDSCVLVPSGEPNTWTCSAGVTLILNHDCRVSVDDPYIAVTTAHDVYLDDRKVTRFVYDNWGDNGELRLINAVTGEFQ